MGIKQFSCNNKFITNIKIQSLLFYLYPYLCTKIVEKIFTGKITFYKSLYINYYKTNVDLSCKAEPDQSLSAL